MTTSLRDDIESRVLTYSHHANEQGTYKICANEILKVIEKRIDSRLQELESDTKNEKLKNLLGKEKWKIHDLILTHRIGELENVKKEMLK